MFPKYIILDTTEHIQTIQCCFDHSMILKSAESQNFFFNPYADNMEAKLRSLIQFLKHIDVFESDFLEYFCPDFCHPILFQIFAALIVVYDPRKSFLMLYVENMEIYNLKLRIIFIEIMFSKVIFWNTGKIFNHNSSYVASFAKLLFKCYQHCYGGCFSEAGQLY